jgi:hypothetical protein
VAVAHLTLDLGPRHQCGDRVDHDDVQRTGPDQHVRDLQRLLTGVWLRDQQRVGVDAQLLRVVRVQRVLGVDERRDAAGPLGIRHRVQRDRGLTRGLRAVDLDDAAAWQPADPERHIQRDRPGGDHVDRSPALLAEPHDRALAALPLDLRECGLERLLPVGRGTRSCCSHAI